MPYPLQHCILVKSTNYYDNNPNKNNNIAFGRAYSNDELSQQAVSRSVLTASEKKEQLSRKKKSRFSECTRLIRTATGKQTEKSK